MPASRSNALAWWSAVTIFVSAFLLFQVQPVITKKILPWFGGSPAVWTTCVLFFQLVLLGGYAYAHLMTHCVHQRWQAILHLAIVLVAVLTLFMFPPSDWWKPANGDSPALRILILLAAVVGLPYFVLSTTGPLVQAWFARLYPGRSPYRLYSLSNIGSLGALLTYPFLIETTMGVDTQGGVWALVFIVFATLIGILALNMWRHDQQSIESGAAAGAPAITAAEGLVARRGKEPPATTSPQGTAATGTSVRPTSTERAPTAAAESSPPKLSLRIAWLALAALASLTFLAITNHLCQDIAVVPFMWVIPLSLYLLSFIICFDNERWYLRKTFGILAVFMVLWLTAIENYGAVNSGMEYVQKFLVASFTRPTFETPEQAAEYGKLTFAKKIEQAELHGRYVGIRFGKFDKLSTNLPITFSKMNDGLFDGIGWVVKKIDGVWQSIVRDRTPVKLASGETFATLDKDKNGKLAVGEFPVPPLTALVEWDVDSDGEVTEEEFNIKAGNRQPTHLVFDVDTYDFKEHMYVASAAYLFCMFCICMVCHGELVKSKPAASYLTSFYLSISAGGALGGLFVGVLCPLLFKSHFEFNLGMIGGFVVGWITIFNDGKDRWLKGRELLQWAILLLVMAPTAIFAVRGNMNEIELRRVAGLLPEKWQDSLRQRHILAAPDPDLIAIERNFYGTVTVSRMGSDEDPYNDGRALYNGRIWHGFQFTSPERELEPSTYYVTGTGAALAVQENPRAGQGLRVAVIGLGSGSMAAHAKKGDTYRFYDIDPKVEMVARKYFTYLEKIPKARDCTVEVVMGDARLSLERELKPDGTGMNYDVLHLDAFSGDAIPAHLCTDEAFELYTKHLRHDPITKEPTGIIVVHISNRYLNLEPVVAAIAKKHKFDTRVVHKDEDGGPTDTASDWILVTRNQEFLNNPRVKIAGQPLEPKKEILWTDQKTALWDIMK